MRLTLLLIALLAFTASLTAQRVLLFEKLTDSRSERLYEGEMLRFKMKGDNFWQEGPIRQMRPDIQALVINDRFIMTDEIAVIDQGNTVFAAAGYGLMTFGAGWSFWGVVGTATDGNPTTRYETRDLMVSLTAIGTGFLMTKLLGKKRYKTGKYKRLRVVDTSF
jgi:hypothetical protein